MIGLGYIYIRNMFLDAIASLDLGYESLSVRLSPLSQIIGLALNVAY